MNIIKVMAILILLTPLSANAKPVSVETCAADIYWGASGKGDFATLRYTVAGKTFSSKIKISARGKIPFPPFNRAAFVNGKIQLLSISFSGKTYPLDTGRKSIINFLRHMAKRGKCPADSAKHAIGINLK